MGVIRKSNGKVRDAAIFSNGDSRVIRALQAASLPSAVMRKKVKHLAGYRPPTGTASIYAL